MADPQQRAGVSDCEAIISRLRGVSSARVVTDGQGGILEIHVVADDSRSPKQLCRDIESALLSELGVRVDHRKISIAQLKGENPEAAAPRDIRLKFLSIEYAVDRSGARARVSVGRDADTFVGVASEAIGPELRQEQLVARAAVAAVEEFLRSHGAEGTVSLELGDFTQGNGTKRPFVMVTVRVLGNGGEENLLGSALVRDDPWRAAACAVLDAMNRRLPSLM